MGTAEILQIIAAAGGSSYVAVLAANRTNIANIQKRLDELIKELKRLRDDHHRLDKQVSLLEKIREEVKL